MLHFLAQVLEEKYPDIVGFMDETIHIEKAARGKTFLATLLITRQIH